MPKEEIEMMRDAFVFLRDHNNPPANGTEEAVRFWMKAAGDAAAAAEKWGRHPLMTGILKALYGYLEEKGKGKGERKT